MEIRRLMNVAGKCIISVKSSVAIIATLIFFVSSMITLSPAALAATQPSAGVLEPLDMQNLIFVWASGTASIQQQALHI